MTVITIIIRPGSNGYAEYQGKNHRDLVVANAAGFHFPCQQGYVAEQMNCEVTPYWFRKTNCHGSFNSGFKF